MAILFLIMQLTYLRLFLASKTEVAIRAETMDIMRVEQSLALYLMAILLRQESSPESS
jgi:hypothetical protein